MTSMIAAAAALLFAAAAPAQPALTVKKSPVQPTPTDRTMAGQPLVLPSGPLQVVSEKIVLSDGAPIPVHIHFWARYVYVEKGEAVVTLVDSGRSQTFKAGSLIVEPIGKWHFGKAVGETVLISVEQVPAGRCNTVYPPEAGKPNDC